MASAENAEATSTQVINARQPEKSDKDIDAALAGFADDTWSRDALSFSPQEQRVLDLYDQLKELELEKALVQAQNDHANGTVH